MSDNIPEGVVTEILSRLPVEPLLRFRCVSHSWKDLIDSQEFIKMHFTNSIGRNSNHKIIIRAPYLYSADFDSLDKTNCANFEELNHPLKSPESGTEILGSCNGLLALSNSMKHHILWNPSTGKYQKVPFSDIDYFKGKNPIFSPRYIVYGFGFDSASEDYKVVRLIQFYGFGDDVFYSEVKVYSLRSNTWKNINDLPYALRYGRAHGKLANGALHWVVSRKPVSDTAYLIIAIDLATEECSLVSQPEYPDKNFHMNVEVLGGCLCVMCNYYMDRADIWVMKDYGGKESWTKLISLKQCDVPAKHFKYVRPISYSKYGKRVLLEQDGNLLLWYDLDKKSIGSYAMKSGPSEPSFSQLEICVQSLIPLNDSYDSPKVTNKKQTQEELHKKPKKRDDFLSKGFKLVL